MQYNKINKKGSDCMHHCVGNDDLENKKIYEESLRPEGIRKTVQVKESAFKFENRNIVHSPTKIKQRIHRNTNIKNRRAEKAVKIAAIATIISILISILHFNFAFHSCILVLHFTLCLHLGFICIYRKTISYLSNSFYFIFIIYLI